MKRTSLVYNKGDARTCVNYRVLDLCIVVCNFENDAIKHRLRPHLFALNRGLNLNYSDLSPLVHLFFKILSLIGSKDI